MLPIETVVFLQLWIEYGKPRKVSELNLLAVDRINYLEPENTEDPHNRLTLSFSDDEEFDQVSCNEINAYLSQQKPPVCLMSYTGNKYDFPILNRHLKDLKVSLSDDIMCADSYWAFDDILERAPKGLPYRDAQRGINEYQDEGKLTLKRLQDIYERVVTSYGSSSEKDILKMTYRISLSLGKKFLDWVDENQRPLASIEYRFDCTHPHLTGCLAKRATFDAEHISARTMLPIETFVFLQLWIEYGKPTKLSELNLIAVDRINYLKPENTEDPHDRLTMSFSYGEEFDQVSGKEINYFLSRQKPPVCLMSYTGNRYDFPILNGHLKDLKVSLSDNIMCADSCWAFYDILEQAPEGLPNRDAQRSISYYQDEGKFTLKRLQDIYERVVRSDGSSSEKDILKMTYRISLRLGQKFLDWVDKKQRPFASVEYRYD